MGKKVSSSCKGSYEVHEEHPEKDMNESVKPYKVDKKAMFASMMKRRKK